MRYEWLIHLSHSPRRVCRACVGGHTCVHEFLICCAVRMSLFQSRSGKIFSKFLPGLALSIFKPLAFLYFSVCVQQEQLHTFKAALTNLLRV